MSESSEQSQPPEHPLVDCACDHRGVCTITMKRGDKGNALNLELMEGLQQAYEWAENSPAVKATVLRSDSPKIFCVGLDLNLMEETMRKSAAVDQDEKVATQSEEHRKEIKRAIFDQLYNPWIDLYNTINSSEKPTIAVLQGSASGGGLTLASVVNCAISTENFKGSYPEKLFDVHPWGSMYFTMQKATRRKGVANASHAFDEMVEHPQEAQSAQWIHDNLGILDIVVPADKLEETLSEQLRRALKQSSPEIEATPAAKKSFKKVSQDLAVDFGGSWYMPASKREDLLGELFAEQSRPEALGALAHYNEERARKRKAKTEAAQPSPPGNAVGGIKEITEAPPKPDTPLLG